MSKEVSKRKLVENQLAEVVGQIEHGECFYADDMMGDLLEDIAELRNVCLSYRKEIYDERGASDE